MKKYLYPFRIQSVMSCKRLFLPILALVFFSAVLSAAPDIEVGKNLFKNTVRLPVKVSIKTYIVGYAILKDL